MIRRLSVSLLILAFGFVLLACSASPATAVVVAGPSAEALTQSSEDGAVTIDVQWAGVENDLLVFNVAMNTHSVNLDVYDLTGLALLRDSAGNEYGAVSWEPASGGHHVRGVLRFPVPEPISLKTAEYVEMVIKDVAEIAERILRWELN